MNPLKLWKSLDVKNLLIEFYSTNFVKSGVDPKLAEEYIQKIFDLKDKVSLEDLIKISNKEILRIKRKILFKPTEARPIDIIDYSNVNKYLDIGANRLTTIRYLSSKLPKTEFFAVDLIPANSKTEEIPRLKYYHLKNGKDKYPIENKCVDMVNLQFVLHHFNGLDEIEFMLSEVKRVLKPNGSLIVWEETYENNPDINKLYLENKKIGIQTDKNLTEKFYNLTDIEKKEFIIVNDWLLNSANKHINWHDLYFSLNEWLEIFQIHGFVLEKYHNLGLRNNGLLKQGKHIIVILKMI